MLRAGEPMLKGYDEKPSGEPDKTRTALDIAEKAFRATRHPQNR